MLIDSHCHIPHSKYDKNISDIVIEAKEQGVVKMINIGTSLSENKKAADVADKFPEVYSTAGIFPHEERGLSVVDMQSGLQKLIDSRKGKTKPVVAIGECGIDISDPGEPEWENARPLNEQLDVFDMQVNLALKNDLPLIIHNSNGDDKILEIMQRYKNKNLKGVAHCFSSTWDFAKKLLDLGLYISFTGRITYPSRRTLFEVVEKVPYDRYLVETDSPYLPPQGHRGETNYPKYVKIVAEKVAQARKEPFDKVSQDSYSNTCTLFKL